MANTFSAITTSYSLNSEVLKLQRKEVYRQIALAMDAAEKAAKAAAQACGFWDSEGSQDIVEDVIAAAAEAAEAAEVAKGSITVRNAKAAAEAAIKAAETAERAKSAARKIFKAGVRAEKRAALATKQAAVYVADRQKFRLGKPEQVFVPRLRIRPDGSAAVDLIVRNVSPQIEAFVTKRVSYPFVSVKLMKMKDGTFAPQRKELSGLEWAPNVVVLDMKNYYLNRGPKAPRKNIEGNALYVDFKSGHVYRIYPAFESQPEYVYDMTDRKRIYDMNTLKTVRELPSFGGSRGGQISGSSGMKEKQMILLRNDGEFAKNAAASQRLVTVGLTEKLAGKSLKTAQAIKAVTRLGSHLSPEARSAKVEAIAIFGGKYADGKMDGEAWTTLLSEGDASHERGAGTLKAQLIGASEQSFKTMLSYLEAQYGYVELVRDEMTAAETANLDELLMSKTGRFAGKVVRLVTEKGQYPEVLGDLNAFKAPWDYKARVQICSQGLYTKRAEKRLVTLGSQVVFKALGVRDEKVRHQFVDWFLNEFKKQINDRLETKNIRVDGPDISSGVLKMLDSMPSRALYWLNHKAYTMMPWLRRRDFKNVAKDLEKAVRKLQIQTSGYYLLAKADPATFFGLELLKVNEVLVPTEDQAALVRRAIMVKYPSMGLNEYMLVDVITYDDYKSRVIDAVNQGLLTQEQAMAVLCQAKWAAESIIVSANPLLVKALAGADFDTDHFSLLTDQFLVDFFQDNLAPVAVMVDTKPVEVEDDHVIVAGPDMVAKAFQTFMELDMKSVGEVTNFWKFIQALYLSDNLDGWKEIVQKGFGNRGTGKTDYVRKAEPEMVNFFKVIHIDGNIIRKMVKAVKRMALTEENLRASLEDFVLAVPRHDQEITVDGGGHAYSWYVGGGDRWLQRDLFNCVHEMQKKNPEDKTAGTVHLEILWDKREHRYGLFRKNEVSDNWGIVKDLQDQMLSAIDDTLFPRAVDYAFNDNNVDKIFWGQDQIIDAIDGVFGRYPGMREDLERCANIVATINRMYAKKIKAALKVEDEDAQAAANAMYQTYMAAAERAIRQATPDLSAVERFAVVAAMTDASISGSSKFAGRVSRLGVSLLKEETAAWLEANNRDGENGEYADKTEIDWDFRIASEATNIETVQLWGPARDVEPQTMIKMVRGLSGAVIKILDNRKYLDMVVRVVDKNGNVKAKPTKLHLDVDPAASAYKRLVGKEWIVKSAFYAGTLSYKESDGRMTPIRRQAVVELVPPTDAQ